MRPNTVELAESVIEAQEEETYAAPVNPAALIVAGLSPTGSGILKQTWRWHHQKPEAVFHYRAVEPAPQDAEQARRIRQAARRAALMPAFGLLSDDDQPADGTTYQREIRAEWD
jgi:hypothetical protein